MHDCLCKRIFIGKHRSNDSRSIYFPQSPHGHVLSHNTHGGKWDKTSLCLWWKAPWDEIWRGKIWDTGFYLIRDRISGISFLTVLTAVCSNAQGRNLVLGTGEKPLCAYETILIKRAAGRRRFITCRQFDLTGWVAVFGVCVYVSRAPLSALEIGCKCELSIKFGTKF